MGVMQQKKGKRFEKLVARLIFEILSVVAVRNMEQCGEDAGRDLLALLPFCLQCQHAKKIHPYQKLAEAKESTLPGEWPVAVVRQDRKPILAVMYLEDWLELVQEFWV